MQLSIRFIVQVNDEKWLEKISLWYTHSLNCQMIGFNRLECPLVGSKSPQSDSIKRKEPVYFVKRKHGGLCLIAVRIPKLMTQFIFFQFKSWEKTSFSLLCPLETLLALIPSPKTFSLYLSFSGNLNVSFCGICLHPHSLGVTVFMLHRLDVFMTEVRR